MNLDLSSRRLRYFVVLAEELHFSRAADRLQIAQQALSRQIRDLERSLGIVLFERTTRRVELTPAGRSFLATARSALATLDDGVVEARAIGGQETLRLGYVVGGALELMSPILTEFRRRHPGVVVEMREHGPCDRSAGLADRSSDVAFVRLPVSGVAIDHEVLFVEPLVAAVPSGHRFASRAEVSLDDLAGETIVFGGGDDPAATTFWSLSGRASREHGRVIAANSLTEELSLVATGEGCSITTAASARYTPHPSIRFVRVAGGGGVALVVGWRRSGASALVADFVATSALVRDREQAIVAAIEHPALG